MSAIDDTVWGRIDRWWGSLTWGKQYTLVTAAQQLDAVDWDEVQAILASAPVVVSWPTGVRMFPPAVMAKVMTATL